MARENIDIGVQGNDGTGDSIRESFRKVNENFTQLFAIFGSGDRIGFTDLDDTPNSYGADQVIVSDAEGTNLLAKNLVGGEGIAVDHSDENEIRIISTGGKVSNDIRPSLGGHLNAQGFGIGNVESPSEDLALRFNGLHDTNITEDELVVNKGYADKRYLQASGGTGTGTRLRIQDEPEDTSEYVRIIDLWSSGYARLENHGFNQGQNGIAFRYYATIAPATGLIGGQTYYLRFFDKNRLSVHATREDAVAGVNRIVVNIPEVTPRGTEYFEDAFFDTTLEGNWLSNDALPRKSIVRRQGDTMEGALTLHDHPGSLAGSGTPNGADDLQAATKFYVDSSSFASAVNLFVATNGDDNQTNTPAGKEGRALAYAYETVGAACAKAEELISLSLTEPGPYRQLITYGNYNNFSYLNSIVTNSGNRRTLKVYTNGAGVDQSKNVNNRDLREGSIIKGIRSGATGKVIDYSGVVSLDDVYVVELLHTTADVTNFQTDYFNASAKLLANKEFIQAEVVAYIQARYPDLVFNPTRCGEDAGLIVDAIAFDIKYGGNNKTITAARSYWNGVVSQLPTEQTDETVQGITYINLLAQQILADTEIADSETDSDVGRRTEEPQIILTTETEALSFVVVGRLVDSITKIVANGLSGDGSALEFLEDETLEFGQPVPEQQISIRLESGVYYEQLPIRIPTNVSIKGDEFRRSIVRPAPGQSTSRWADIYFYRDEVIDGLTRTYQSQPGAISSVGNVLNWGAGLGDIAGLETGMYIKVTNGTGEVSALCQVTRLITTTSVEISEVPEVALVGATIRGLNSSGLAPVGENFGYHYLIDPSDPASPTKSNKDMDVFLLNDGTIIRNITVQGHGGFMCVLDPEGQIQTKSPYFQTATCLSGSVNKQSFRGGMFIDGFSGNLPANITGRNSSSEITLSGLTVRAPGIPTSFYIDGERYQINAVEDYDQTAGTARVILDESTPWPVDNPITVLPWTYPYDIIIETPGNRSMLCNDFTQVNDLGYGIVATNNGLCEAVSVFTYYNHISYLANNGAQIRSVTGSSCYGNYGLKAAGRDPNEVPDPVTLADNTLQVAKIYRQGSFSSKGVAGDQSIYIDYYNHIPFNISEIEIDHSNTKSGIIQPTTDAPNNIIITDGGTGYTVGEFFEADGGTLYPNGAKARFRVTEIDDGATGGPGAITELELIEPGLYSTAPTNPFSTTTETVGGGTDCEITAVFLGDIQVYEVSSIENTSSFGSGVSLGGSIEPRRVLKLNLNTASGDGLKAPLADDQLVIIRGLQNFRFLGVEEIRPVRPSTALEFTDTVEAGTVYRTLSYNLSSPVGETLLTTKTIDTFKRDSNVATINTDELHGLFPGNKVTVEIPEDSSFNVASVEVLTTPTSTSFTYNNNGGDVTPALPSTGGFISYGDQAVLSFDTSFNYAITQTNAPQLEDTDYVDGGLKTMGASASDTRIAIQTINSQRTKDRLNSGNMITSWAGKLHQIVSYTDGEILSADVTGATWAAGTATITTDGPHGYQIGDRITVTGIVSDQNPTYSYDGVFVITDVDVSEIEYTYAAGDPGVYASGGEVIKVLSAYIEIDDVVYGQGSIVLGTGLAEPFTNSRTTNIRSGLAAGAPAEITVRISTCRATGHDFLDVGSGGFNSSNYPNNLYGAPVSEPTSENVVVEETQGRVFHVSTDQDGIFRVGRFFEVDQGTGTVTFSASIALSNLDGIGFKRGTVVKEFSTDDTMTDNDETSVPVESAIRGYIDRRLGVTHTGVNVPLIERIPALTGGFLPVSGTPTLEADLSMGSTVGHRITNLVTNSASDTDAANVGFVNDQVETVDSWYKLKEVLLMSPVVNDVPVFIGGNSRTVISTTPTGDVLGTLTSTNLAVLANSIIGLSQLEVNSGVVVVDISGFPTSGHFQIGNEIFSYSSTTPASNRFDGVVRAAVGTAAATHTAGAQVIGLNNSRLNVQIQSEVIVNADISTTAAIAQGKINLTDVTEFVDIATTSTNGIASFNSDNFAVSVGGEVTIKNGGVALAEIQNISAGTILGNLTASATAPQEVTTTALVGNGINSLFTSYDVGANIMTRRFNSLKTSSTMTNLLGTAPASLTGVTVTNVPVTRLTGSGNGAVVSVTYSNGGVYTNVSVTYGGNGYAENDQLFVPGTALGGTSPGNDLQFTVAVTGNNIDTTVYLGLERVSAVAEANSVVMTDSAKNLGTASYKFNNVHATTFNGALVGNAATATKSNNLIGSVVGSVPYQSAIDTTILLSPGTSGRFLMTQGAGQPPAWTDVPDGSGGTLSGDTLASNIINSSLTSFGDLIKFSVNNNIIAAGTDIATATVLTKNINIVTDVAVDTGVRLPTAVAGYRLLIRNSGLNNVKLYPSAGASINDDVEGSDVIVESGAALEYFCAQSEASGTGGRWYTINATFA